MTESTGCLNIATSATLSLWSMDLEYLKDFSVKQDIQKGFHTMSWQCLYTQYSLLCPACPIRTTHWQKLNRTCFWWDKSVRLDHLSKPHWNCSELFVVQSQFLGGVFSLVVWSQSWRNSHFGAPSSWWRCQRLLLGVLMVQVRKLIEIETWNYIQKCR